MNRKSSKQHYQVTLIALDKMLTTSLTLPMEMLNAARAIMQTEHGRAPRISLTVAGTNDTNNKPVIASGGIKLLPDCHYSQVEQADLIIVPAMWRNPQPILQLYSELIIWLKQMHLQGSMLGAAGTGSYLLAGTGLLDGKPSTTHWYYFDRFQKLFPTTDVKRDHLITHADGIFCTGSVNSIADLTINLIEQWFGEATAARVRQQFSPEIRRSTFDSVFETEFSSSHRDELVIASQQLLKASLNQPIDLSQIAKEQQVSQRTLNRRFQQALGMTPLEYLTRLRLEQACELLRETNLGVAEVAEQSGFSGASYLAKIFRKHFQITPGEYRTSVRGKLFTL
ncbi:GlxA family transcriptional regulator [Pelagibaculum spongiae]|uniref:AraC family transcriptional regulator n=1 Tax=Pelagibaculum spongiae TaxID=2080658 RepID=A0A2V1H4M4_9GAMM|nr:helix-turn-helix domain-containing protein [Pelagibaculum spongiae]PVZ72147.1 AraC family transcriptional regulator [Pelagibaculum spongiae]